MKQLITILLLTSSLCYGQNVPQDYASTEAEMKQRKKHANGKVITGVVLIGLGVAVKASTESNKVTDFGSGVVAGVGATTLTAGIIEKIEIGKEERGKRKARNNKKQD